MSPSSKRSPVGVEPSREVFAFRNDVRLEVEPEDLHLEPVDAGQEVVESEGEVRAAGPEIHDAQTIARQRADDVLHQLDESVDLPELRPPRAADPAVRCLHAERHEVRHGLALRQ